LKENEEEQRGNRVEDRRGKTEGKEEEEKNRK
jgi:hypothetical protein